MRAAAVGTADEKPTAAARGRRADRGGRDARGGRAAHAAPLAANLGSAVIGVFHKDNLVPLLAGGAATGIASIWDQEVREAAQPYEWGESLETAGGPIWSSVFVVGMFTAAGSPTARASG